MLGAESEEISPDQQKDALKEATNVVCGNFLPEIAGPEAVFHIDAPVLHPGDYTVECGEGPYICVPLNIEEEPCSISFCADARILEIQWPEGRS
jgi:CheY-specific phosphatase CheX